MATAGEDNELRTEARNRLDGGLNSRGSPLALPPEALEDINDFRFTEAGALTHRQFASLKVQATWNDDGDLPAPTVTALVGSGTLAAGDYEVKYYLSRLGGLTATRSGNSASSGLVAVGANGRIQIDIAPNNLGEGIGQGAGGADDPFNGGTGGPELLATQDCLVVLVKKSTDPDFTVQALSTAFAWNSGSRVQRAVLSAYSVGSALAASAGSFPLRHIAWHPGIQRVIGWVMDRALLFASDLASFTRFPVTSGGGAALDKAGNPHRWSRLPTRMKTVILNGFMVAFDGIGRPKSLHWTGSAATSQWRLIGANPPASAPSAVDNGAGVLSAGDYIYLVTFSYRHTRGDVALSTADCESNSSAQSTPLTLLASRQARVTLPTSSESGLNAINIYRTEAGGSTFYFVASVAAGTGTYDDNTADADITDRDQPPDAPSKASGNDMPPNILDLPVVHGRRLWAVRMEYVLDASTRIVTTNGTNEVFFTKVARVNSTDIDQREDIDAWPFKIEVGGSEPITATVRHHGRILCFKDESVHYISGTGEDDADQDELFTGLGAMKDSVLRIKDLVYFWDQAAGPCVTDGSEFNPIGYDIQPTWAADRAAGYFPVSVWHDPLNNEIHWNLSKVSIAPPARYDQEEPKEYVYYIPTKKWTRFTAFSTAGFTNRAVNAACLAMTSTNLERRTMTLLFGLRNGKLVEEDQTADASDELGVSSIQASMTMRFFFGDMFEMIKQWISVFVYADLVSAGAAVTVHAALLSSQTFQSLGTIDPLHGNNTVNDVVRRLKFKTDLITRPGVGGSMMRDRALLIKIVTSRSTQKLKGVSVKFKDYSDEDDKA